jgi:hypothetical protein
MSSANNGERGATGAPRERSWQHPRFKPKTAGYTLLHQLPERVRGAGCGGAPCLDLLDPPQGISPLFPGVLVGPPHVRKCHQTPSKEHMQLGWVVL